MFIWKKSCPGNNRERPIRWQVTLLTRPTCTPPVCRTGKASLLRWEAECDPSTGPTFLHTAVLEKVVLKKVKEYRKISIISPGLIFVQKAFLMGLFSGELNFRGIYYWMEFVFQNGLGLTIKTVNSNSPRAYVLEGLLSEGYLRLRFEGLIFARAWFWEGLLPEFYGMRQSQWVVWVLINISHRVECLLLQRYQLKQKTRKQ